MSEQIKISSADGKDQFQTVEFKGKLVGYILAQGDHYKYYNAQRRQIGEAPTRVYAIERLIHATTRHFVSIL